MILCGTVVSKLRIKFYYQKIVSHLTHVKRDLLALVAPGPQTVFSCFSEHLEGRHLLEAVMLAVYFFMELKDLKQKTQGDLKNQKQ